MPAKKNLTGQRFGRLVAVRIVGKGTHRQTLWECRCDCGVDKICCIQDLQSGAVRSCGCLKRELAAARLKLSVGISPGICKICGAETPVTPGRGQVFCSENCRKESHRLINRKRWESKTPEQKERHNQRVCADQKKKTDGQRVCEMCGVDFIGPAFAGKNPRKFCSPECLDKNKRQGAYRNRHKSSQATIEAALLRKHLIEKGTHEPRNCPDKL